MASIPRRDCPGCRGFIENIVSSAGRKVTESTKATPAPIATSVPRWRYGGTSEKFIITKPNAVVALARKIGFRFTSMDRTTAADLESPAPRRSWTVTRRCRQLATASVSTMIGVAEVAVENGIPTQPATPIAVRIDRMTTPPIAAIPASPRVRTPRITAITAKDAGNIVPMAATVASVKV